jgi:hypothetical protein
LIADEGAASIAEAIQKAAKKIGFSARGSLPDERQVRAALISHQALFQSDSQPLECKALREIAVAVMHSLTRFSPWLTGAVLDGTANGLSKIELEVILNDCKQLEMFLLNAKIPFETRANTGQSRGKSASDDNVIYEIWVNDACVWVTAFANQNARLNRQARTKHDRKRAQIDEVKALLATANTG